MTSMNALAHQWHTSPNPWSRSTLLIPSQVWFALDEMFDCQVESGRGFSSHTGGEIQIQMYKCMPLLQAVHLREPCHVQIWAVTWVWKCLECT